MHSDIRTNFLLFYSSRTVQLPWTLHSLRAFHQSTSLKWHALTWTIWIYLQTYYYTNSFLFMSNALRTLPYRVFSSQGSSTKCLIRSDLLLFYTYQSSTRVIAVPAGRFIQCIVIQSMFTSQSSSLEKHFPLQHYLVASASLSNPHHHRPDHALNIGLFNVPDSFVKMKRRRQWYWKLGILHWSLGMVKTFH